MAKSLQLTATYTRGFDRITVRFFSDDSAEVASLGNVTEAEEMQAAAAEGSDIPGWSGSLA